MNGRTETGGSLKSPLDEVASYTLLLYVGFMREMRRRLDCNSFD
jgi:hypothetical protein